MKVNINSSVGDKGVNLLKDVKVVQALLNVYLRRECKIELGIDGDCGKKTIGAITDFQVHELKMVKPDSRVDPELNKSGRTFRAMRAVLAGVLNDRSAMVMPTVGLVTFNSEGMEGGFYHSRTLHVPGPWSGLTIGRGYDMKTKSASKIQSELIKAGVSSVNAKKLSGAHGKSGAVAEQFIIDNDLLDFQISPLEQKKLFLISYADIEKYIKGIYTRNIATRASSTEWSKLDSRIREIVIDLGFRGDYTSKTRKFLLDSIADNDFEAFKKEMSNRANWMDVPADRFERRIKSL